MSMPDVPITKRGRLFLVLRLNPTVWFTAKELAFQVDTDQEYVRRVLKACGKIERRQSEDRKRSEWKWKQSEG